MADPITIEAITGLRPDAANDLVHIDCATHGGDARLDLQSGALSTLMLGLRQAAVALKLDSKNVFSSQALEVTGVGLISRPDGKLGLELVLDGSLRVILLVPEGAISPLHECLFALDEYAQGQPPEPSDPTQH